MEGAGFWPSKESDWDQFEPDGLSMPIDPGIRPYVLRLRSGGVETARPQARPAPLACQTSPRGVGTCGASAPASCHGLTPRGLRAILAEQGRARYGDSACACVRIFLRAPPEPGQLALPHSAPDYPTYLAEDGE
jgi:hypothetical protein